MNDDSALSVVVLPEPVPPQTSIVARARTARARKSSSGRRRASRSPTRSSGVKPRRRKRRIVSAGPSSASGGITTFTREPSGCVYTRQSNRRAGNDSSPSSAATPPARTRSQSPRCSAPMPQHGRCRRVPRDADDVPAFSHPRRHALRGGNTQGVAPRIGGRGWPWPPLAAHGDRRRRLRRSSRPLRAGPSPATECSAPRRGRAAAVSEPISEARVRRRSTRLRAEGWRVRHGVTWPGRRRHRSRGRSPNGFGFAIETKTLRFSPDDNSSVQRRAQLARPPQTAFPRGVLPVLCVVHGRRAPVIEQACSSSRSTACWTRCRAAAAECPTRGRERRVRRRAFGPWRSDAVGL